MSNKHNINKINFKEIGNVYGELTVLSLVRIDASGNKFVRCKCSCGDIKARYLSSLKTGATTKCKHHEANILIGKKHGELTAIRFSHTNYLRQSIIECKCSCGNIIEVVATLFKSGKARKKCYNHKKESK